MNKKGFLKFLLIILSFVLIACTTNEVEEESIKDDVYEYFNENFDFDNLTEDDKLPTLLYDANITYNSSDESVITKDGFIYQGEEDELIILEVIITKGNKKEAIILYPVVLKKEPEKQLYPIELDEIYLSCLDLYGEELLYELRDITTKTHTKKTTYGNLRQQLAITDADPNNPGKLIVFYLRKSVSSTWDGGNTWNREHVWPQSLGWFKEDGAGCDIHHIRPTNSSENSRRGNSKFSNTAGSGYYVPNDEVKGDIARILFYLKTRYKEADSYPFTKVAYSLDMLLEWNRMDPVDEFEIRRNNESQKIQGNYNPFIIHPEFADLIWGDTYN